MGLGHDNWMLSVTKKAEYIIPVIKNAELMVPVYQKTRNGIYSEAFEFFFV